MLKNYLKITLRNILNQKLYSSLNVFGLALGLACTLVIFLFVRYELSFDRFHKDAEDIYRIVERQPGNVYLGNNHFAVTPASLSGELKSTFPEIAHATTFNRASGLIISNTSQFDEKGIWADSNFFDVFAYPLAVGDAGTVLNDPGKMLLTELLAAKVFGSEDPVGKTLQIRMWATTYTFEVAGIVKDIPTNTQLVFDFILPIHANREYLQNLDQRRSNSYLTYLKLRKDASPASIEASLPAFGQTYLGEEGAQQTQFLLEKMTDAHLYSKVNFDIGVPGDIKLVYLFTTIGLLILLLACVNYMNLAVARSMKRAKEVGLRQVIGARRIQIAGQFMCESVFMAFLGLGLGVLLTHLFLPTFSELVDRPLIADWRQPMLLIGVITLVLFVGLVSGSYPALFMARLKPVQTLKGRRSSGRNNSGLQQVLIVLQYTVSIALIAGSLVIYQQLQYIQNKEVGYRRDHIVSLPLKGTELGNRISTVLDEMRRLPNVEEVTIVSDLPTNIGSSQSVSKWEGHVGEEEMSVYQANVGYDFFDVFDIDMVAGRQFSPEIASDTLGATILNETAVRQLGWSPEEAPGKQFNEHQHIIGVMKDFHLHSLHQPIAPMMVRTGLDWYDEVAVRIRPERAAETIESLMAILAPLTPYPMSYKYLDDEYKEMYEADVKLGKTIGYFAFIAILIASLGLFGLAAYATERRTKEIGVRKVLGASVPGLLALLSREFLGLVLVSIVLSAPVAYFIAVRWLDGFAYKVDFGAGVFLLTALLAILIAVLTVSYQAFRAATTNPVKALRYE